MSFSYSPSPLQSYNQAQPHAAMMQDYGIGVNMQDDVIFPSMTPPYVDCSSTSADFSMYVANSSENKSLSSFYRGLQQANSYECPNTSTSSNFNQYNPRNINLSTSGHPSLCENYTEQPLTPPSEDYYESQMYPETYYQMQEHNTDEPKISESSSYVMTVSSCDSKLSKQPSLSKWKRKQERERLMLPLHVRQKRRQAANARERKRMTSLNEAFTRLRAILPRKEDNCSLSQHVQSDESKTNEKELSKMEALQMAQAYITQLADVLDNN